MEVRGAWSQSPGFRSNSANVLGSLALGNKMLTEAAVLTAAHRVPSPALRKYRANIPQALSTVWGIKEGLWNVCTVLPECRTWHAVRGSEDSCLR